MNTEPATLYVNWPVTFPPVTYATAPTPPPPFGLPPRKTPAPRKGKMVAGFARATA